jgi:magnesium chelatase family protein
MLIGSMNPCPCGFLGDPKHECSCNQGQINKYLSKISGPLLDRMDIQIEVSPVYYDDLNSTTKEESSMDIKARVLKARKIQLERYKGLDVYTNSQLSPKHLEKYCKIDRGSHDLLKLAFDNLGLSARAYSKILKVARTISDLEGCENITQMHIAEAIQYRSLDRKYWG